MGKRLKIKKIKGVDHYKLFSTASNSFINKKWLNRDELINFIFWDKFRRFLDDFTKDALEFPNRYFDMNDKMILSNDTDEIYDLQLKMIKDDDLFMSIATDQLKKIGVSLEIKDEKYGFSTNLPKVIWEDREFYDVISFNGTDIHLKTTSEGGTYFTSIPISAYSYRKYCPTKAGARIKKEGQYTKFDIFDDYGNKHVIKLHNSLKNIIEEAQANLINENLILS